MDEMEGKTLKASSFILGPRCELASDISTGHFLSANVKRMNDCKAPEVFLMIKGYKD